MSDPSQQPSGDPYRPQPPYQPQPPYGQQPPLPPGGYPSPGYPPPGYPGYGYAPIVPIPPRHPNATTAMVLGIVALAGAFLCVLPVLVGPVAWVLGARAVKQIDASPTPLGGRGEAMTGKVCGIIASVLLALALLVVVALVIATINDPDLWDEDAGVIGILGRS